MIISVLQVIHSMKYGDKIIYMEGIITKISDGGVDIDLKGRLGHLKIPMRMLITDYELRIGQEVGFNMSFIEQLGESPNEAYVESINHHAKRSDGSY